MYEDEASAWGASAGLPEGDIVKEAIKKDKTIK